MNKVKDTQRLHATSPTSISDCTFHIAASETKLSKDASLAIIAIAGAITANANAAFTLANMLKSTAGAGIITQKGKYE
jgi:hypothetical protein